MQDADEPDDGAVPLHQEESVRNRLLLLIYNLMRVVFLQKKMKSIIYNCSCFQEVVSCADMYPL